MQQISLCGKIINRCASVFFSHFTHFHVEAFVYFCFQLVSFLILVDQSTPHGLESSILHSNQQMNIAPQPVVGGDVHWLNTARDHSIIHATRQQPL